MKNLFVAAILALLQIIPAAAQEPNVETFARSRAHFVGLFEASVARIGRGPAKRPGAANPVTQVFGIPDQTTMLLAAEVVFADQRGISISFGVDSTDVILTQTKHTPTGTVVTAFHTDLTLILRGAASGESADTLQLTASDSDSLSEYRQLLTAWEYHLPRMLDAARNKPVQ